MFRHLKCHPQGASCALLKLHTDFMILLKKLLKYKIINLNKILIARRTNDKFQLNVGCTA